MTEESFELIAQAMGGVRVIVCPRCNGLGEVGLPTLRATCPVCRGCGESTANVVEVDHADT